jgi:hypothetical protein
VADERIVDGGQRGGDAEAGDGLHEVVLGGAGEGVRCANMEVRPK